MEDKKKVQIKKQAPKGKATVNVCPVTKKCGGCTYQGVPYNEQLKKKKKEVTKLLKPYCEVKGILGMEHPYEYRNKVHAVFARLKNGKIISDETNTNILSSNEIEW